MLSSKATILNGWWVIVPWMFHHIEYHCQVMIERIHYILGFLSPGSSMKVEEQTAFQHSLLVVVPLKDFQAILAMMNGCTVISTHDWLRRLNSLMTIIDSGQT